MAAGGIGFGVAAYNDGGTTLDVLKGVALGMGIGLAAFGLITVLATVMIPGFAVACGFTAVGLFNLGVFTMAGGVLSAALSQGQWINIDLESNSFKDIDKPITSIGMDPKISVNYYV